MNNRVNDAMNVNGFTDVSFIDLTHQVQLVRSEFEKAISDNLKSTQFVGGDNIDAFTQKICCQQQFSGSFITCANGTDAIWLVLKALNPMQKKLYVGCPDLNFWAGCEAIVNSGNVPVLLDVDPDFFQLSYSDLVEVHQKHPLDVLLLPHLFGWCSDRLHDIREFCFEENIVLIEDGAQSYGVKFNDKYLCSDAEISTISFYPSKVLGGCMDGGGIFVTDQELALKIQKLANHGRKSHYEYENIGINSRMSSMQGAYLNILLKYIPTIIDERIRLLSIYEALISEIGSDYLKFLKPPKNATGNGYLACCMVKSKNTHLIQKMMKADYGIETSRIYPSLMSDQPANFNFLKPKETKVASSFSKSILNLPIFFGLKEEQIKRIVHALEDVLCRMN